MAKLKLQITNNKDLAEAITKITLVDRKEKPWTLTYQSKKKRRSLNQNALYWMWIACICDEMKYDKDNKLEKQNVHDGLRELFLPYEDKVLLGRKCRIYKSTTKLNTMEFTNYLNSIKIHMITEYAIDLPLPGDRLYDELIDKYEDYSRAA